MSVRRRRLDGRRSRRERRHSEPGRSCWSNIIHHLDHYGSFDGLVRSFDDFVAAVPGLRVRPPTTCRRRARARRPHDAGFAEFADYRIVDWSGV
jgi:hypothetical protein